MQDVDAAPARLRRRDGSREGRFAGDVGLEGDAFALGEPRRLLRRCEIAIDGQHPRAFLDEAQDGRTAVADPLARALTGTDDERGLVEQARREARGHGACKRTPIAVIAWPRRMNRAAPGAFDEIGTYVDAFNAPALRATADPPLGDAFVGESVAAD